jgi:hypothetical protein
MEVATTCLSWSPSWPHEGRTQSSIGHGVNGTRVDGQGRATALAGDASILVAIGGIVIALAVGTAIWPYLLFCLVGGGIYLVGLVIYRDGWARITGPWPECRSVAA